MQFGKKFTTGLLCLLIFVEFIGAAQTNQSVYIVSKHSDPSKAEAFSIDGNEVTLQAMVDISTYNQGLGAVGNVVWPDKDLMFVTYESSDMIVWTSTKTLKKVGEFDTNINNLSGIAIDKDNEKIYIIQRYSDNLYVYSFDEPNNTLVLDNHYDLGVPLGNLSAWGIALDETNDLLYITTSTKTVHVYDTNDWSHDHNIDILVSGTDRSAVGIAVDPSRGYLYTGHWKSHNYLVRTSTASPYTSTEVEITKGAYSKELIGIDVDENTGYVYCTTYHNDFRVYDSNLVLQDTEENSDISGPGGVAVGGWYKTPSFSLTKDNNDPNNDCVYPFDPCENNYLSFDIFWDANNQTDSNVMLIDYLPKECDYYSSIPAGDYNSSDRTVTWDLGDISADDSNCFFIKTKVNNWARPGCILTNLVILEGDNHLNEAVEDCNVYAWGGEIIYVDKDANGFNNGTSWNDAYNVLQDGFTGARNCGAAATAIWVAAGTYKPTWDADNITGDETFALIEDVGVFGHFGGIGTYETSTSQRNFADANNETILDGQIGDYYYEAVSDVVYGDNIENAIVDGFTITRSYGVAGIYLNSSDASIINCKLKDNYSYGVACYNFSCSDIHNCTFIDNSSYGLYASLSCWPEVSNCVFDGNDTTSGGIYMTNYTVITADNCLFKDHTGDGIYGSSGTLNVANSIFEGNNDNGIEISDVTSTVTDCSIKNSNNNGIQASNSDLTIDHSVIAHSTDNGLYTSSGCNLTFKNSVVRYSGEDGIELNNNLVTTLKNNWIHNNGTDEYAYYYGGAGISFKNQSSVPLVRNNTIFDNYTYGIESSEYGADPNVINCIIYANDSNDFYRENGTFDTVSYCCLEDGHSGIGNITNDPCLMNPDDPNDYHISNDSLCKDAGDPNGNYGSETDIDSDDRIVNERVDMGADEYYWSPADFDEDGIVNFADYAVFADAWLAEPNDDNYNQNCDFEDNNSIDYNDLDFFCTDWLWEPAWGDLQWMMCMGSDGAGFGLKGMSLESSLTVSTGNKDALMLSTAIESLNARPQRLANKSQKFYDVTPANTISNKQKMSKTEQSNIEEIIKWFDEIWLAGELGDWTEDEYQEFRKAVEESAE